MKRNKNFNIWTAIKPGMSQAEINAIGQNPEFRAGGEARLIEAYNDFVAKDHSAQLLKDYIEKASAMDDIIWFGKSLRFYYEKAMKGYRPVNENIPVLMKKIGNRKGTVRGSFTPMRDREIKEFFAENPWKGYLKPGFFENEIINYKNILHYMTSNDSLADTIASVAVLYFPTEAMKKAFYDLYNSKYYIDEGAFTEDLRYKERQEVNSEENRALVDGAYAALKEALKKDSQDTKLLIAKRILLEICLGVIYVNSFREKYDMLFITERKVYKLLKDEKRAYNSFYTLHYAHFDENIYIKILEKSSDILVGPYTKNLAKKVFETDF